MYKCEICGKEYERLEDRIECETKCLKEQKAAEELKKQNEYKNKRAESAKAIYEEFNKADKMVKEHLSKYKSLSLDKQYPYLKYVFDRSLWWF